MNKQKIKQNIICSLVFCILSIILICFVIPGQVSLTQSWSGSNNKVNGRTLPYIACLFILAGSLFELVGSILRLRKAEEPADKKSFDFKAELRAFLVFLVCILYLILFDFGGYFVATIIAPPLILVILKDFNWKHYLSVYVVGLFVFLIFQYLLKIRLI